MQNDLECQEAWPVAQKNSDSNTQVEWWNWPFQTVPWRWHLKICQARLVSLRITTRSNINNSDNVHHKKWKPQEIQNHSKTTHVHFWRRRGAHTHTHKQRYPKVPNIAKSQRNECGMPLRWYLKYLQIHQLPVSFAQPAPWVSKGPQEKPSALAPISSSLSYRWKGEDV